MRRARLALSIAALTLAAPALGHTVWLMPEAGGWRVLFGGHAGAIDPYPAAKLKTVTALAASGARLAVTRRVAPDGVHLTVAGTPSLILAHYDNGIHTKRSNGPSVEKPMDQVPHALGATRAIKYHKTIAAWTAIVARPAGQPFEVVPLSATQPVAGTPMRVRVLIAGKPAPGIKIARNEEGSDAVTNAQGIASYTPVKGFNKLWSGKRTPIKGNRAYTEDSIEYSLGFVAR
jgi:nickel transport protein